MAKRNTVTDAAPAAGDLAEEAKSLLKRLIDETQLRDAVAALIDEAQARAAELPAKGRQAAKEAQDQLEAAQKQAKKQAKKQLKNTKKAAAQQLKKTKKAAEKKQRKLERKGAGATAEGRTLARQLMPGLKGRIALVLAGAVGTLTLSETLRSKVLDLLFGAEEEFQYTPPEPPAGESPAPLSAV